tara:strand:- start:1360 stop:2271 length:912 start_codon:yes stop_codon:yes gene_type:complete
VSVRHLSKTYDDGFKALKDINLEIRKGEIIALLGPNGAGKTTLISVICGIVNPSEGEVLVDGKNIIGDFRATRSMIGLVPQELTIDSFSTVFAALSFSRGLFGKAPDPAYIESVLKDLSLWDKRNNRIVELSGGMKRRVLIGKALAHQPTVLFLDEPTAGVDVELRKDMWALVRKLRDSGVTIILTTHYIEEAEEIADRIGIVTKGEILLVEEKDELMRKLGKKQLILDLVEPLSSLPESVLAPSLEVSADGATLTYTYDTQGEHTGITDLMEALRDAGIRFKDMRTTQRSLEDIFVKLVEEA